MTRDTAGTGAVTPAPTTRKTSGAAATPTTGTTRTAAAGDTSSRAATGRTSDSATKPTSTAGASANAAGAAAQTTASSDTGGAQQGGSQQGAAQQGGDKLVASPAAYQGWKTFHVYCYRCHGTDALGSDLAPNLRHSVSPEGSVTHDVFVQTVKDGRLEKGMPAWKEMLSDEQIENLYTYIKARSDGSLAAGRPRQGSN
jgi:mono/diheme cytochrome c family protein